MFRLEQAGQLTRLPSPRTPATKNDLYELEARLDARLQAVAVRFLQIDRVVADLDQRVSKLEPGTDPDPKLVAEIVAVVTAAVVRQLSHPCEASNGLPHHLRPTNPV